MLYTHSAVETPGVDGGTGLAIDYVERVLLRRRGFEEFKRMSGLSDQAVVPSTLGSFRPLWYSIIFGSGGPFDSVQKGSAYCMSGLGHRFLSWQANQEGEAIIPTHTGTRTPLTFNLNEACREGAVSDYGSSDFSWITVAGGERNEGRKAQYVKRLLITLK